MIDISVKDKIIYMKDTFKEKKVLKQMNGIKKFILYNIVSKI